MLESCPSGRRCSTRNAVSRKGPRVRIPDSPPIKSVRVIGRFFYAGKQSSKTIIKMWSFQFFFRRSFDTDPHELCISRTRANMLIYMRRHILLSHIFQWPKLHKICILCNFIKQREPTSLNKKWVVDHIRIQMHRTALLHSPVRVQHSVALSERSVPLWALPSSAQAVQWNRCM